MNTEKFTEAMDRIGDRYITEAAGYQKTVKALHWKKWGIIAACFGLAVISAFTVKHFVKDEGVPRIEIAIPAEASPFGMRKYMNCNGRRYVFMENGSSYALSREQLKGELGKLEHDIRSDPENNSKKDFSATFALGGTVYEMTDYNPDFRVAVEWEDNYYICQSVGLSDNTPMNAAEYFKAADFRKTVTGISVYDHRGTELLAEVSAEDTKPMIDALSRSQPAELTDEEYQLIGKAQKEGRSFQLFFALNDGTIYKLYVIPSLEITMIGDNRYILPEDFSASFGQLFDGLAQQSPAMF